MKPPPRTRTKSVRCLANEEDPQPAGKGSKTWQQVELRKLLKALKTLGKTAAGRADLNYSYLEKCVPTRSVSEIQAMVERLKKQVILYATCQLRNKTQEEEARKPIEKWTDLAHAVTGSLEETINTAFLQILIVSSTEPLSLRNCGPPQFPRSPPDCAPTSFIPTFNPSPQMPIQAEHPMSGTVHPLLIKTPSPTVGPAQRLSAPSQVVQVPTTILVTALPSVPTSSVLPVSPPVTTTTTIPAKAGETSKRSVEDTRRTSGDKDVVDFEKIYCYLSTIQKPSDDYKLTPMESAVVLDLLMSLPEELPLLDCNELHKHLTQVYQCFSAPSNSKKAKRLLKELKEEHCAQAEAQTTPSPSRPAPDAASVQPQDGEVMEVPPLNPFIVPLNLLRRK